VSERERERVRPVQTLIDRRRRECQERERERIQPVKTLTERRRRDVSERERERIQPRKNTHPLMRVSTLVVNFMPPKSFAPTKRTSPAERRIR
jgi:hypothetical protein